MHVKYCFAPAIFYCFLRVPYTALLVCQLIHQRNITSPRNLCNDPLHYCIVRPALGKFPHIFDISRRKSRHIRECILQVFSHAVDNFRTPSFFLLLFYNGSANVPVKTNHTGICIQYNRNPLLPNLCFNFFYNKYHSSQKDLERQEILPRLYFSPYAFYYPFFSSLSNLTTHSQCTDQPNISTGRTRFTSYPNCPRYFTSLASVAESQLT